MFDAENLKAFVSRLLANLQDDWELTIDFEAGSLGSNDVEMDKTRLNCHIPYSET